MTASSTDKTTAFKSLAVREQGLNGLSMGLGESFFPALIVVWGASQEISGVLATLPIAFGSFIQVVLIYSQKQFSTIPEQLARCYWAQSLLLIVLAAAGYYLVDYNHILVGLFFICASLYWGANQLVNNYSNIWMSKQIDPKDCCSFFFSRAAWGQSFVLLALILASAAMILNPGLEDRDLFSLFLIGALLAKVAASFYLPPMRTLANPIDNFLLPKISAVIREHKVHLLYVYLFLFLLGVHMSAGFFTPYVLRVLNFSYFEYTSLIATMFLARAFVGLVFSGFTQRFGPKLLISIGTIGVAPLPMIWWMADNFYVLLASQVVAGLFWSAFELGLSLLLIQNMDTKERMVALVWTHVISACAIVVGGLTGYLLAYSALLVNADLYSKVFQASFLFRSIPIVLLPYLPKATSSARILLLPGTARASGFSFPRFLILPGSKNTTNSVSPPVIAAICPQEEAPSEDLPLAS